MNDMKSKLGIDFNQVEHARSVARKIADGVQDFVEGYTTVAVERTLCRLIGIDGVDANAVPLPNVVVEELREKNVLGEGALFFLGNAIVETGLTPQQIAEEIAAGKLDITRSAVCTAAEREAALKPYIDASIAKIAANRQRRENYIATIGEGPRPYLYVIVATGNIYEDVVQAQAAARQGADIIAVIRTTGQSLLDYVPYGATTEGFGGTFATQENFRIMRKALDEVGEEVGRYIRLCNYCSGLCMPEIAVMGALEGLDVMLNDALYGILFRDINMQRTLVDQYMSRVINGFAGVIINTGEDNYLTTADAVEEAHTVLASDLINEQLALLAGLPEEQMGLGHAFEMDPMLENGFLYELAQAQIVVQLGSSLTGKRVLQWQATCEPDEYWLVDNLPGRLDPAQHRGRRLLSSVERWLELHPAEKRQPWATVIPQLAGQAWQAAVASNEPFGEAQLAQRIRRYLPEQGQLFVGNSLVVRLIDALAQLPAGYPVYSNRGASGIDGLIATAAGVQRASARPTLAIVGDLSALYDLNSLALLRQASAPLVLIVVNNNGGQIFSMLPTPQDERRQFYLMPQDVDFSHAAAMFGLAYHRPDDWPSLDEALAGAWRRAGATVIELAVNETDGAQTLQQLLAQVSRL